MWPREAETLWRPAGGHIVEVGDDRNPRPITTSGKIRFSYGGVRYVEWILKYPVVGSQRLTATPNSSLELGS